MRMVALGGITTLRGALTSSRRSSVVARCSYQRQRNGGAHSGRKGGGQMSRALMAKAREGNEERGRFVVTTPLYYVNAKPHMGSAYPTIASDAIARFHRMQKRKVSFVTGTDEHGEKIAMSAAKRSMAPKEHCDSVVEDYKYLWSQLDIAYDSFIRTTDPKHEETVAEVLERVWEKGDIYEAEYEGLYCVDCEEYKDEQDLDEQGHCPIHRKPCDMRKERNYFFRLSKYQKEVEDLLESNPDFVRPATRRNEVLGWVKGGLRDFSISRAAVEWGIPIARDPSQTVYVWFDALIGYVTALLKLENQTLANNQEAGWPASVHIIGKDILRFHAVYWPAMLMSAGMALPGGVFGHGFLTKDGLKMGKSLGNVLDPVELVEKYGPDAVRYFFLREMEFGKDGDFSETRFIEIVNANLANGIGNCLNRTLNMLKKNCKGVIPYNTSDFDASHPLRSVAESSVKAAENAYSMLNFSQACEAAVQLSNACDRFLEERQPWTKLKKGTEEEKEAASKDLMAVLEASRVAAYILWPVVPSLSSRIIEQLAIKGWMDDISVPKWEDAAWGALSAGHETVGKPTPVFMRLELPQKQEETATV